ncbi:MAG TPA: cupredoxin family copper-binding protein [Candidatus Acidoferrales bacterium]|nr:cupredoxin family copper-binding protein [Candidatus Acidoferrales bacterium]
MQAPTLIRLGGLMRFIVLMAAAAAILMAGSALADTTAGPPAPAAQIIIENYTFRPATLTIAAGTKVTWKNLDDDPHTATDDSGAFDSKGLAQGDSFSFVFTKPGTYNYHCTVHPFMKASIVVVASTPSPQKK